MLHEVLVYLWCCPDDVFTDNKIEDWIEKKELCEFLHQSERALLAKILRVAVQYHEIEYFRKKVTNLNRVTSYENGKTETSQSLALPSEMQPGIYLKAFCNGLEEALKEYRADIILLESKVLKNPQMTLTDILTMVSKYVTLLGTLMSLIKAVQIEQVHGCRLMERLHVYTNCGVQVVENSMKIIMQHINPMFYRHLCNWIVYGTLNDIYNEFFIRDAKCSDEKFMYPEQLTESNYSMNISICLSKKQKIKRPTIVQKFVIEESLLPSIIPVDVAETILFMGRIVWIVRNKPKSQTGDMDDFEDIWEGKDYEFYQKIQALEKKPFELVEFIKVIEDCRSKLTKYLWTIMVDNAKLLEHLQLIRDYYGLGRGELFQQFLTTAEDQLKDNPSVENVNNQLNFLFRDTARRIYGDNDKTYKRFKFHIPKVEKKTKADWKAWNLAELHFNIRWPLHIVFHPHAMNLYNKLFAFLLRVKQTHIDIHSLWWKHTSTKAKINKNMWSLLHNLMFLVNNLQYYLQVDVLEAQFSILKNSVKNANEFEDIIRLHSLFLSNLLSQSFIMSPDVETKKKERHNLYQVPAVREDGQNKVFRLINALLELCDDFCMRANVWDVVLLEPELLLLERYKQKTDELIQRLLKMLYSLHKQVSGQHLMQLLHRLDFNCFYSKTATAINI